MTEKITTEAPDPEETLLTDSGVVDRNVVWFGGDRQPDTRMPVQGISEFFVLIGGGYSPRQALTLNFIISSTILVGSVGGYFLLDSMEILEVPLLGLAAGAFLIVVLHDLIPHSIRSSTERLHYMKHLVWFAIGVILMFIISLLFAHE